MIIHHSCIRLNDEIPNKRQQHSKIFNRGGLASKKYKMDSAFHISILECPDSIKKRIREKNSQRKTKTLREEYDILEDGIWTLR